jgi:predicted HicB family RNase H-like nuclease
MLKTNHGGENMATINLRDFPDDLHQAAKIKAVVDKTTLREIIIRALREYVKKPGGRSRKKEG